MKNQIDITLRIGSLGLLSLLMISLLSTSAYEMFGLMGLLVLEQHEFKRLKRDYFCGNLRTGYHWKSIVLVALLYVNDVIFPGSDAMIAFLGVMVVHSILSYIAPLDVVFQKLEREFYVFKP